MYILFVLLASTANKVHDYHPTGISYVCICIVEQINWKQEINSSLTPILIGNLIVTVSPEGYLFYIDHNTGNIVKIINVLDQLSNKLKNNANPIGFTMTYKNLYLSMSNGRLVIFDIKNDKIESISKFDNNKISRPFIFDQNIFIAKDNSVIKIN